MLTLQQLQNTIVFMKRANAVGEECLAWTDLWIAVQNEIQALTTPVPAAPTAPPFGEVPLT